jgi:hypothetical protein
MANIQIKHSPLVDKPSSLLPGELAYSEKSDTLFVGTSSGSIAGIGGGKLLAAGSYKGEWNASTNTPTITSGVGNKGDYYKITVTGNALLDTIGYWQAGDFVVFDGTYWTRVRLANIISGTPTAAEELNWYNSNSQIITKYQQELAVTGDKSKVSTKDLPISVNVSGAEWDSGTFRNASLNLGVSGNLTFPDPSFYDYLKSQKVSHIRLCFSWEGLQPTLFDSVATNDLNPPYYSAHGDLHSEFLANLVNAVSACQQRGINVTLDNHSFGQYKDNPNDPVSMILPNVKKSSDGKYVYAGDTKNKKVNSFTNNLLNLDSAGYLVGEPVTIPSGAFTIPPELAYNTKYYVVSVSGNSIGISATPNGTPLTFTDTTPATSALIPTISISWISGTATGNSGRYFKRTFTAGTLIKEHLADVWLKIHQVFNTYDNVVGYGLSNEAGINTTSSAAFYDAANYTISVLRNAGCNKVIYVDGPYTDSSAYPYHTMALPKLADPLAKTVNEIHTYFDASRSGSYFGYDAELMTNEAVESGRSQIRSKNAIYGGDTGFNHISGIFKAASLIEFNRLAQYPAYIGEYASPSTSDDWQKHIQPYIHLMRGSGSMISIWGASTNKNFLKPLKVYPQVTKNGILPDRQIAPLVYDANENLCKLELFIDGDVLIIENVGASTYGVTCNVEQIVNGVSTVSSVVIPAGINQYAVMDIVAGDTVQINATSGSNTISVTKYRGDTPQGWIQNTNGVFFKASTGIATLAGGTVVDKAAVVCNSIDTNNRYFIKQLETTSEKSVINVTTDSLGRKAWVRTQTPKEAEYLAMNFYGSKRWKKVTVMARDNGDELFQSKGFKYNNGPANDGVGATLSNADAPNTWATFSIDSYIPKIGDLIAVLNNYVAAGIYIVTTASQDGTGPTVLTRHPSYTSPRHFDRYTYVQVRAGVNNKNMVYSFVPGSSWYTGTWTNADGVTTRTGLSAGWRGSAGYKPATGTSYNNYNGVFFFGCVIRKTANFTDSTIMGLTNPTGSGNQGGWQIITQGSNQNIAFKYYSGDDLNAGTYGYLASYQYFAPATNTDISLIVTYKDFVTKVYVDGVLIGTNTMAGMRDYNFTDLSQLSVCGAVTAYNANTISDGINVYNAVLGGVFLTDTQAAQMSDFLKQNIN